MSLSAVSGATDVFSTHLLLRTEGHTHIYAQAHTRVVRSSLGLHCRRIHSPAVSVLSVERGLRVFSCDEIALSSCGAPNFSVAVIVRVDSTHCSLVMGRWSPVGVCSIPQNTLAGADTLIHYNKVAVCLSVCRFRLHCPSTGTSPMCIPCGRTSTPRPYLI